MPPRAIYEFDAASVIENQVVLWLGMAEPDFFGISRFEFPCSVVLIKNLFSTFSFFLPEIPDFF